MYVHVVGGQTLERRAAFAPFLVLAPGTTFSKPVDKTLIPLINFYEPRGFMKGQRSKNHCVNRTKNGCVRADAERQREDDGRGETGALADSPSRVTNVFEERFEPRQASLIAHAFLQSARLLSDGSDSFREHCVVGIEPRSERMRSLVEQSLMLVTALTPHIGYDRAAKIALHAHRHGMSLREAALALGVVSAADFDSWVRPEDMAEPSR